MPNATINNPDNFLTTGESRGIIFSRITLSDPDGGEAYFSPIFVAQPGNFGTLTFGTNPADPFYHGQGFLTYQFGNAEFLRRGESIRDTFTIASVDGTTKDVTFTIIGENDPATIGDAPAKDVWVNRTDSGLPDGFLVVTGTISVTDVDQNESNFAGSTYGGSNRFDIRSDGSYQYVVANSAVQSLTHGQTIVENVTVFSRDGTARGISFTIHGPDASPIITSGSTASRAENSSGVAYQAAGSDPEGTTLTWSLSGTDAARFSVNGATGAVSFLASPNFEAPTDTGGNNIYDITVTASDGIFTTSQAVAITVTDVNDNAPLVTSGATASIAENSTGIAYQATGSDADSGTTLAWTLGGTDAALFDIDATGAVTFKTAPNFEAPADGGGNNIFDITVTASDGTLSSAAKAVAITVTNVNEAPAVTSGATACLAENATGTVYQASGIDPDAGTTLAWSLGGTDAALFDINAATGEVTFKAAPNFETPADDGGNNVYDITVTASDGTLSSAAKAVAITVTNVNEAPSVTSGATASFAENDTGIAYQASGIDPDAGTTLIWTLGGTDAGLFDIDATGAVTFKTAPDFEAPADAGADNVYDISVIASDGGLASSQDVALTVTDVVEAVRLVGGKGSDSLVGTVENDTLIGLGGADTLKGNDGADRLNGGVGADSMDGGTGNDVYTVNEAGDTLTEAPGGGADRVVAAVDWTLGAEFEHLTLTGTADIDGTGNDLANRLIGNAGANILDAGAGNDVLLGRDGNDTLRGGDGTDVLEGGAGADSLVGGLGNDRFVFRGAADADGDVIGDFSRAERDRVDLRPIDTDALLAGDQGFAWIGTAAFGHVAGQLRFDGGMLLGDLDGDGAADFQIGLAGLGALTAASILL